MIQSQFSSVSKIYQKKNEPLYDVRGIDGSSPIAIPQAVFHSRSCDITRSCKCKLPCISFSWFRRTNLGAWGIGGWGIGLEVGIATRGLGRHGGRSRRKNKRKMKIKDKRGWMNWNVVWYGVKQERVRERIGWVEWARWLRIYTSFNN